MTLQSLTVPEEICRLALLPDAARLIDLANDSIEAFMLSDANVSENFVPCDFHLLDQALSWIEQSHLLTGSRFCELGSGFGVAAMLASLRGMESVGIEIEANLVEQASNLAESLALPTKFFMGSFVPRNVAGILELGRDMEHVETHEDDVFDEIGLDLDEFDLFFAFPWPGEHEFFEAVFEAGAADNSLLLTYRGRDGMHLLRKT